MDEGRIRTIIPHRHFIQTSGTDSFQTTLPDRSRIEISTERDGSLKYYRHFDSTGGHTLEIKFGRRYARMAVREA